MQWGDKRQTLLYGNWGRGEQARKYTATIRSLSNNDGDGYENITSEFAQVIQIGGVY